MNLTVNFTLHELTKSEAALRHDMDNTPNEVQIASLKLLAEQVLQPIRDHYAKGVKVNSGFRHPDASLRSRRTQPGGVRPPGNMTTSTCSPHWMSRWRNGFDKDDEAQAAAPRYVVQATCNAYVQMAVACRCHPPLDFTACVD